MKDISIDNNLSVELFLFSRVFLKSLFKKNKKFKKGIDQ